MTSLQKGLVGHWTMDDADTSGGTLYDSAAYDNHGNLAGGIITGASSPIGEAYSLDGADDVVTTNAELGEANQSFTANVWFKGPSGASVSENKLIIGNYVDGGHSGFWWIGVDGTDSVEGRVRDSTSSNDTTLGNFNNVFDGVWYMYTFVRDATNNQIRFYRDGSELGSTSFDGSLAVRDSDSFVGFGQHIGDNNLQGDYSGGRIYNRALSESEISALYNMRSQRQKTNDLAKELVGHWTMDDADTSGGTLYDRSSYDNHGTLQSGVSTSQSGIVSESYFFDGSGAEVSLNRDTTGAFAIAFWVNFDANSGLDSSKVGTLSRGNYSNLIGGNNGKMTWFNGAASNGLKPYSITTEVWYHVVCQWNGTTREMYVDGVFRGSVDESTVDSGLDTIGGDGGWGPMYGNVDDVRIYNRVLPESEISALYNNRT